MLNTQTVLMHQQQTSDMGLPFTDPLTHQVLPIASVFPNNALKAIIERLAVIPGPDDMTGDHER